MPYIDYHRILSKLPKASRLGLVLYCSSKMQSNPGHRGVGVHGYVFDFDADHSKTGSLVVPPSKEYITNQGYTDQKGLSEYSTKVVSPLYFVEVTKSFMTFSDNLKAETEALCQALKVACELNTFAHIVILSDSVYAVSSFNRHLAVWVQSKFEATPQAPEPQYAVLWKLIHEFKEKLQSPTTLLSVKLDKSIQGKAEAKYLAQVGCNRSLRNEWEETAFIFSPKKLWGFAYDRNPHMKSTRLYFSTDRNTHTEGEYYLSATGDGDDAFGNRSSEFSYTVAYNLDPKATLEQKVIGSHCAAFAADTFLCRIDMNHLYHKPLLRHVVCYGQDCFTPQPKTKDLLHLDGRPVSFCVNPSRLVPRAIEVFGWMSELIKQSKDNQYRDVFAGLKIIDITNAFFESAAKSVVLKKVLCVGINQAHLTLPLAALGVDKEVSLPLVLGMDLPTRNDLAKLAEQGVKVELLAWPADSTNPDAYRFMYRISTSEASSLWSSAHSDRFFVGLLSNLKSKKIAQGAVELALM